MDSLPAVRPPSPPPVLSGMARLLDRRPRLANSGQYLGFFGAYLALYLVGATLPFRVGFAFMAAMTVHVWIQAFPTRLSRAGLQGEAARLAAGFADHADGELAAVHRLDQADFSLRGHDVEGAKSALAQVDPERLPEDQRMRYFQVSSSLWMQVGDPEGALVMSEAVLAMTEGPELAKRPELLLHRALALMGADRRDEALECLRQAEAGELTVPQRDFLEVVRTQLG